MLIIKIVTIIIMIIRISTPNMTGRRFHRTMEMIPPSPGSLKALLFPSLLNKVENNGGAPKERRRRRAEKRLSKRVFLESPFFLCPLKVFKTFRVF